jgi:hypothetical protein
MSEKDGLTGIPAINLKEGAPRLTEQVAARMYAIRCRIVHAKDARDAYAEPLLPYSREASQLGQDLVLAEFLCQKVIIAGSNERL